MHVAYKYILLNLLSWVTAMAWCNCDIHQIISLINPSLWQLLISDWQMRVPVLQLISHSKKDEQLA